MEKEIWKHIPESDDHVISNFGRMKKLSSGVILKPQTLLKPGHSDVLAYAIHNRNINNKKHLIRRAVSVCVMRAFRPDEYVEGKPIYRKDGNINNNYVDNFMYENKNATKAKNKREDWFDKLSNNSDWIISGSVEDIRNRVKVVHTVCGHSYIEKVETIYRNKTPYCLHCAAVERNNTRKTELSKKLFANSLGRFEIVGKMTTMDAPVNIIDHKYEKEFVVPKAKSFLNKHGVFVSPFDLDSESVGESMTEYILDSLGYKYMWQYYFNDCRNIKPLPFDFAVFRDDDTLAFVVEYQGKQHYEAVGRFSQGIEERVRIDGIKRKYCDDNGISLLVLSGDDYRDMKEKIISFMHK